MNNDTSKIKKIVEALIIVSENGISKSDLMASIPEADLKDIQEAIQLLNEEYISQDRAFNIVEIAGRYRVSTKPEFMPWISNLYQKEIERLTGPSLETLAILAYKQPATRAEIEAVRGVNVGGVLKALLDRDLVRVKGRRDTLGRPLVYETTDRFLELFGLSSLDDLPQLREFEESDLDFGRPEEQIILEIDEEEKNKEEQSSSAEASKKGGEEQEQNADIEISDNDNIEEKEQVEINVDQEKGKEEK